MESGRIILAGTPGTGKTTAASIVAAESNLIKSVYVYRQVRLLPSQRSNRTVFAGIAELKSDWNRGLLEGIKRYAWEGNSGILHVKDPM